jgi:hypothetical protein
MLAEMQQQFRNWLVDSSDNEPFAFGLNSTRGLTTYQNNYRTQLVNCLKAIYPQLLKRVGDDIFLQAAIHHIDRHPPSSWTLDAYGANFGNTLLSIYPNNPDLSELAWIEWALSDAFVAADASIVTPEQLTNVDWDAAQLVLSPSLSEHTATTNAVAVWSALVDGNEPPEGEMLDAPTGIVVWRRDFVTRLIQVDAIEYKALLALRDDNRFSTLCDTLVEQLGEEEGIARSGNLLAGWIASGIVVGLE